MNKLQRQISLGPPTFRNLPVCLTVTVNPALRCKHCSGRAGHCVAGCESLGGSWSLGISHKHYCAASRPLPSCPCSVSLKAPRSGALALELSSGVCFCRTVTIAQRCQSPTNCFSMNSALNLLFSNFLYIR